MALKLCQTAPHYKSFKRANFHFDCSLLFKNICETVTTGGGIHYDTFTCHPVLRAFRYCWEILVVGFIDPTLQHLAAPLLHALY